MCTVCSEERLFVVVQKYWSMFPESDVIFGFLLLTMFPRFDSAFIIGNNNNAKQTVQKTTLLAFERATFVGP